MSPRQVNYMRSAVVGSVIMVVYGNVKAYADLVVLGSSWAGGWFGVASGLVAVGLVGLMARHWRLSYDDLGLSNPSLRRGLAIGVGVGIPVALVIAGVLIVGTLLTGSAERLSDVSPIGRVPWLDLLRRVSVLIWLDTAIPEEFVFRGLVLGLLLKAMRPLAAVAWSAVPFTLWHAVVVWHDSGSPAALVYSAKLAGIFVGGLYFGAMRVRGRHLSASIVAHWAYDFSAVLAVKLLISL